MIVSGIYGSMDYGEIISCFGWKTIRQKDKIHSY